MTGFSIIFMVVTCHLMWFSLSIRMTWFEQIMKHHMAMKAPFLPRYWKRRMMLWRKYWNLLVRFRSLVWWKRGIDCLYQTNTLWVGIFMSYEGMDHLFGRNEHAIVDYGLSIMTLVTYNMVRRWNRSNTLLCTCAYQLNQNLKVLWFKLHGWIWREELKIQSRRWV